MSTFRLPDLGEGLAEAEIVEWHVKVGDHVRVDQPMVSVETAKAVVEVPAPFSGIVTALRGAPGDIVLTGAPLIEFDSGTVVGSMPATSEEEFVESVTVGGEHSHGPVARGRAVPAARALAKRLGVDLAAVEGGGRAGLITMSCGTPIYPPRTVRPIPMATSARAVRAPPTVPARTARPSHRPHARLPPPDPATALSSRCAACGGRWRKACRCRGIR
jgi:pyruvate/2-oxoglutarate dehydrogenase complex dihydrolipoamide acyltransferase (E2) component